MYNVLFADDEPIVIESLQFISDHDFSGQCTCFSAENGTETVKICREHKIDIAFIDINMPGINGLEAIKEIKQFNPALVIIILTAFDRFQYAQEAISLGVYQFLTKPVNRMTIAQTLRSAMNIVDSANGKMASDLEIREKLNAMAPVVESDFIYSLIYPVEEHRNVKTYLEYFGITKPSFFFCTLELPHITVDNRLMIYTELHDQLTRYAECIPGPLMINRVVVFIPLSSGADTEQCRPFVNTLYSTLALHVSAGIRLGASTVSSDFDRSVQIYNQSIAALNSIPENETGYLFFGDREKQVRDDEDEVEDVCGRIVARVRAGDLQSVSNLFISGMPLFKKYYNEDITRIKNLLFTLVITCRNAAHDADHTFGRITDFSTSFGIVEETGSCENLEKYVLSCLSACVQVFRTVQKVQFPPQIEKVRRYVFEHIDEDVSLEKVAAGVSMHPAYLSKLFRESTGENFIDFVTSVRMDKAKKLLGSTLLTIKEVTFDCGYNDQNYFSKLFKKCTGQTPTEFRQTGLEKEHAK